MNTIKIIILTFLTFFAPIWTAMLLVALLILTDTITGITHSRKRGEKITSRKMSQVIVKMLIYQFCILTLYLIDVTIVNEIITNYLPTSYFTTKAGVFIISIVEMTSIKENIEGTFGININEKIDKFLTGLRKMVEKVRGATKDFK
jgi:hypothetical protein